MNMKYAKRQKGMIQEKTSVNNQAESRCRTGWQWSSVFLVFSIIFVAALGPAWAGELTDTSPAQAIEESQVRVSHASIDDEEVTPETWRSIHLEIPKEDGSIAKIDLLRPLWWLDEAGAEIGGTIAFSIPEMGIEGEAKILSIGPCKVDSRDGDSDYRVVTGKFVHENAVVLDLYFDDSKDPLGVTSSHPLWSVSRNGWVEAGQLKVGESVKTNYGVVRVTQSRQRSGRHKVFNLEVHRDHTYYVSNLEILAHNNCAGDGPGKQYKPTPKHKKGGWGTEMDLDDATAQKVLDDAIPGGKQQYGVKDGKIYEFQPDNTGGWHGYPIPGNQAPPSALKQMLEEGRITKPQYKKLLKGKQ